MPKALIFDLFGTLLAPRDRRDPYRRLIQTLSARFGAPARETVLSLMREPLNLRQAWARLAPGEPEDEALLISLEADLAAEIDSVEPFSDALAALSRARELGLPFTVCSNLAQPYAAALSRLPKLDAPAALSFENGLLKPEPAMFEDACARLGARPFECAMFGDRLSDDFQGALSAGMQSAWLIDRSGKRLAEGRWPSLAKAVELAARG